MKKVLALLLAILMVVTMATGCVKKEDPRTLLQKTFDQSVALESLSTDMSMSAAVSANDAMLALDPSIQGLIDSVNAGKITATAATDSKKGNMNGKVTLETNGMSFAMDMYMKDFAQMIIKTPMSDKFVTMDLTQDTANAQNIELMTKINKEISAVFLGKLKDEFLTAEYKVPFEGKDGKIDLNYVNIKMDNAQFVTFLKEVIPAMYATESFKQLMLESMTKSMEQAGQTATPEELQKQLDTALTEMPAMLDQMQEVVTFDSVLFKVGIDKDYNTRDMDVAIDFTAKQGEGTMTINAKIDTEYYGFNQPVTATDIEITDENSMPLEDLLMQLIFGGMGM